MAKGNINMKRIETVSYDFKTTSFKEGLKSVIFTLENKEVQTLSVIFNKRKEEMRVMATVVKGGEK